jgi:CBS-domain-containing membrane protein
MLMAFAGVTINLYMGSGPLAVILAVAIGAGVCRQFKLHIPPALAVGLMPFVMTNPDFRFPLAVGGGIFLLAVTFISYRYHSGRTKVARNLE